MKKQDKIRQLLLQQKRERKRSKRKKQRKKYTGAFSRFTKEQKFREKGDLILIKKFKSNLYEFLQQKDFLKNVKHHDDTIIFPKHFSLVENYEESFSSIGKFVESIYTHIGQQITLDFTHCDKTDQAALFLLQIIRIELEQDLKKLDYRLKVLSCYTKLNILNSEEEEVNKLLFVTGIITEVKLKNNGLMPFNTLGYYKGTKSQKHYAENKKGIIGSYVVKYINSCIKEHGYIFNIIGTNYLDGLISEILNNAEDHSPMNTYYVTANLLQEFNTSDEGGLVGELNLSILNFGDSFFEGFERTKEENKKTYTDMEILYKLTTSDFGQRTFSKENLFTLYALQDGMSRLKYERESRGTGTMKFINSFFSFGDYEDPSKNYHPKLQIFTGKTLLICNNRYRPFVIDGVNYLSLNKDNDLRKLPEKSNLKKLSRHFPGTLLTTTIYFNKDHLTEKLSKGNGKD